MAKVVMTVYMVMWKVVQLTESVQIIYLLSKCTDLFFIHLRCPVKVKSKMLNCCWKCKWQYECTHRSSIS